MKRQRTVKYPPKPGQLPRNKVKQVIKEIINMQYGNNIEHTEAEDYYIKSRIPYWVVDSYHFFTALDEYYPELASKIIIHKMEYYSKHASAKITFELQSKTDAIEDNLDKIRYSVQIDVNLSKEEAVDQWARIIRDILSKQEL